MLQWIKTFWALRSKPLENLQHQLRLAAQQGVLDSESLNMMEGILKVGDMRVRNVMVPSPKMVVIQKNATLDEVLTQVVETQHSRYPVMDGDKLLGISFSKDLLSILWRKKKWDLNQLTRNARTVPESTRLDVLLRYFRTSRQHMALVVDEHNEVVGLITIEDVLEQIVGEIEDEHDDPSLWFVDHGKDGHSAKGLTPLPVAREKLKAPLDSESETLGGLLLERFGHLPQKGEKIIIDGYQFSVISMDDKRIELIRIKMTSA